MSPVGSNADTAYAQAAYTGATTQMAPINQQPQYAYDADTTQYGAFSGQPEDPSTIAVWTNALSNVLTQLGQTLASLFGIL